MRDKIVQILATTCAVGMFSAPVAADEAEDLSAAFQADLDRIAAENGVADGGSTVTPHENGMQSTMSGLSNMKMLMVRKNEDGTLSFEHVQNAEEAQNFVESDDIEATAAEE